MIWSYLRTGSPLAIGATAILCPRITRTLAVTPAAAAPSAIGSTATTTLSLGERRTVRGVLMVCLGICRVRELIRFRSDDLRPDARRRRITAVPGRSDLNFVDADAGWKLRNVKNYIRNMLRL